MDKIENEFASFFLKDGILHFIYKPNTELNLDAAKKVVEDRKTIQKGKSYPVLCDIRGLKDVDKVARDFLAKEGSSLVDAVALVVDSPAYEFMANFYLKVSKPDVPTKMFSSIEEALEYIKKFK
ncbi:MULTISPECIES: hypothetical protein [unclassified Imperialibacter]|uniref:DUF7793 family protein n=1 Tax=unclassified Imperialibacter TaxID=2629706 RepID=UPI001259F48B|nr:MULTISPECIES: hypothetical protein [unclassified Imperialibacter]CAD5268119.1 conserved hypothetical protein [Imperialibacter sp. 75]CAD5280688.1 conserved hypothetical protein [Imperialibacter sp. 89]VVT01560.1 conserved hypothetical protein [Imperialibacter sp. EC-SDR9]